MAGSLSHIIGKDGRFTMDLIDHMGDAQEALEECYSIIIELSGESMGKVSETCWLLNYHDPYSADSDMKEDMRHDD